MKRRLVVVTHEQARLMYLRRPFRHPRTLRGVVGTVKARSLMRDRAQRRRFLTSTSRFRVEGYYD